MAKGTPARVAASATARLSMSATAHPVAPEQGRLLGRAGEDGLRTGDGNAPRLHLSLDQPGPFRIGLIRLVRSADRRADDHVSHRQIGVEPAAKAEADDHARRLGGQSPFQPGGSDQNRAQPRADASFGVHPHHDQSVEERARFGQRGSRRARLAASLTQEPNSSMAKPYNYRKVKVGARSLEPETLMLGFGFDPDAVRRRGEDADLPHLHLRLRDLRGGQAPLRLHERPRAAAGGRGRRPDLHPLQQPQPADRRGAPGGAGGRRRLLGLLQRHGGDLHRPCWR